MRLAAWRPKSRQREIASRDSPTTLPTADINFGAPRNSLTAQFARTMKKAARLAPIVAPAASRDVVELAAAAGVKVPRRLQALRKPSPGKMEKASPSERRQSQR